MDINEKIKARRMELGLSDVEVARQAGLTIHEYYDVEAYENEVFNVTDLSFIKLLCGALSVEFFELFELKCAFCEEGNRYLVDYSLTRNELIRQRRTAMGISQEELGDRADFLEVAVEELESIPDFLEASVINNIKDLSTVINVPVQILLAVKCKKCGR